MRGTVMGTLIDRSPLLARAHNGDRPLDAVLPEFVEWVMKALPLLLHSQTPTTMCET